MNKLFKDNILTVAIPVRGETDDYVVRISFGGFCDILHDELERNGNKLDLRSVLRALMIGFNKEDVYIGCSCADFCLEENTRIKLLNGKVVTVKDLLALYEQGEELWVYSVDEKGDFKPGKVSDVWVSGYVDTLVEVTLDNNKKILTTGTHKYMLRDGTYKRADELESGNSLMPLYFETMHDALFYCGTMDNYNHKVKSVNIVKLEKKVPVYDLSVDKYNNFYVDAGVILHNCYRYGYYATKNNISSLAPQNIPSDITNPDDSLGSGCKHILLVLSNTKWIIKVASVIRNYINYAEEHLQRAYAEVIYPAIYKKKYEEPYQPGLFDKDEVDTDQETIDVSNKAAQERGRFKPGNQQGVQFAPNEKDSEQDEFELEG